MFKFKELSVGSKFWQARSYVGAVEFEITDINDSNEFIVSSISTSGYNFKLSQAVFNDFVSHVQKRPGYGFYKSKADLNNAINKFETIQATKIVNEFKDDKQAFIESLFLDAYTIASFDAENHDPIQAQALSQLAAIHFPDLELPNPFA